MKLLISIHFCFPQAQDNALIFVKAWSNFINKNKDKLNCDFIFVNNGLPDDCFREYATGFNTVKVPYYTGQAAWDTDSSYIPFACFHSQYDFILRVDSDAFLTVENIETIISFLKSNRDIDFVSATNFCRPITNNQDSREMILDSSGVQLKECKDWEWKPWNYPTHNSDLYIIRTEFFRQCCKVYNQCKYIPSPVSPHTPFDTAYLTYNQVCDILQYKEDRFPKKCMSWKLRIDGSINTDFWTILCSLKPKMAGIVNHDGRSFRIKNHLINYGEAIIANKPFDELVDSIDIAYPHQRNIIAPYFHMGNAYVSESFFSLGNHHLNHPNTVGQLQANNATFIVAHLCLITLLTKSSGYNHIIQKLQSCMSQYFIQNNIDREKLLQHYQQILSIYGSVLNDYLDQNRIDKNISLFINDM
jgi:hypothetical protein